MVRARLAFVAAALLATGCTADVGTAPVPTEVASDVPVSAEVSPSPRASAASSSPGAESPLTTSNRTISGRYEKATWKIVVPTFSGGAAALEVNRRVGNAAAGLIDQTKKFARQDDGATRTAEGTGKVITNDGRTAQVTITYSDYLDGAAHPSDYVTTTVVDVRQSKPVLFSQVVRDPDAAMRALAPAVKAIAKSKDEDVTVTDGLAPRLSNWAAWQTESKGMIFVFGDYQLGGLGLRTYTVPWTTVTPLLSTYGRQLLGPR